MQILWSSPEYLQIFCYLCCMDFTIQLLHWYDANRRDLPWKHTRDAYKIWLSEIILQQTRVEQGRPYYTRFVEKYPAVQDLAAAPIDEVLRLWQGLGYYSRARNLHHTAQLIISEHRGIFPSTYKELLMLKGIGPYTAAAIASFAFREAVPAVDGNGYRILARVFGIDTPIDTTTGKKQFAELATTLISQKHPDKFNQALMDFGSLVCAPAKPLCAECPLQEICIAYAKKTIDKLPVKSKRTAIRNRYFHYLFFREGDCTYIRKRTEKDIWQGLYEFPLIETTQKVTHGKLVSSEQWQLLTGNKPVNIVNVSSEIKHQLSHQTLHAQFYTVDIEKASPTLKKEYTQISTNELDNYSLPRLLTIFLEHLYDIKIFF